MYNSRGNNKNHGKVVVLRDGGENASFNGERYRERKLPLAGVEGTRLSTDEEGESREYLARFGERRFSVNGRKYLEDTEGSRREIGSRFRGG